MLTKAPRGTKDVLPSDVYKWDYVEKMFSEVCEKFGYKAIRTPVFEHTELFKRGVGETTDIVQKEMYTFTDNGGRDITLKPEGTAPVVRAFIENKLYADSQPTKLFYITPCFRYERPQAGRLRAFHQFGVEVFGAEKPSIDAEVIGIAMIFFQKLGLNNLELMINSIGCPKCRNKYNEVLRGYLNGKLDNLCKTCADRYERNPMRIIDCKKEECQQELKDVPLILDYICEDCREHFEKLQKYLTLMGLKFEINPKIVRGLDYYNKTAFEIISKEIGSQSTVCGGGRYDGLVEEIGGPSTSGVGFGLGIERLLLTLENNNIQIPKPKGLDVFIVTMGDRANEEAVKIAYELRNNMVSVDIDHLGRSTKAQFKYSNKVGSQYTIVIGDNELDNNVVSLKNMDTGEQEEVSLHNIIDEIIRRVKQEV
ncbi:histidine--tRNA ligase [Paramaledivibacter caminithermalis]|jgi:histidyl-tRNA synthetase|uniref:Histidine--tRNA ligase n=1 Tax=Paramaledivibacter caminithermalis (strain DSM 15212 / CIP 107654 / DViRD3) TaxID=1121301 RepID=A0A1M6JW95_PARC5|nr:histidine--tRNA ligase [Paramaledivibacter caminithermalis]SHJ50952.1 histidyl-tRNA synthetase [Paramaledivibacter caminithermalis DSM 15212]